MQRLALLWMVAVVGSLAGCGDSNDGGSTTRAICETSCERAGECVEGATDEAVAACVDQCIDGTGNQTCDEVNQGNLDLCLSQISALSCAQLEAGQAPPICNQVCLVRVRSFDMSLVTDSF